MLHGVAALALLVAGCKKDDNTTGSKDAIVPGEAPLRRLTGTEYDNTVFQLMGDASNPSSDFAADEEASGFDNQAAAQTVSTLRAEQYMEAAEALAADNIDLWFTLAPACDGGAQAACEQDAVEMIEDFGYLVFRRPLEGDEVTAYADVFDIGAGLDGGFDAAEGLTLVVEAMLQSPNFLYRIELGEPADPGEPTLLTNYEIATRMSYALWGSMPDDELFAAAEAGTLHDPAELEYQARRMLAVPRARAAAKNFFGQWLGLDDIETYVRAAGKDLDLFPDYRPSLLPLMRKETEYFIEHAIFDQDASVSELFTADYTMLNNELAEFYGFSTSGLGEGFERVELDPDIYSGFLTHSGLLSLHAKPDLGSPVHRGLFVREFLLCQSPPAMPDVIPAAPTVDEDQTTREQYSQHSEDPACSGCHSLMDPIGFGFENFDAVGRYRASENGSVIDASGEIIDTSDANGTFDGVDELGHVLGNSQDVLDCAAERWFMYAFGRSNTSEDEASMALMTDWFAETDHNVQELMVATTQTDAFRYRYAPDPDEVTE